MSASNDGDLVRFAKPLETHGAPNDDKSAPHPAPQAHQSALKAAALRVLERTKARTDSAPHPALGRTKGRTKPPSKIDTPHQVETAWRPYRFRLKDGQGGGVCLVHVQTLDEARAYLEGLYGDRLLFVSEGV